MSRKHLTVINKTEKSLPVSAKNSSLSPKDLYIVLLCKNCRQHDENYKPLPIEKYQGGYILTDCVCPDCGIIHKFDIEIDHYYAWDAWRGY